jgi:hypothetical protein
MSESIEETETGYLQKEKLLSDLKKDNFGLKLRIYYLKQSLDRLAPAGLRDIAKEHGQLEESVSLLNKEIEIYMQELKKMELAELKSPKNHTNEDYGKKLKDKQKINEQLSMDQEEAREKQKISYKKLQELKSSITTKEETKSTKYLDKIYKLKREIEELKSRPQRFKKKDLNVINIALKLSTQRIKYIHKSLEIDSMK